MKRTFKLFCAVMCCFLLFQPEVAASFSDAGQIVHTDAVESMVELGIINGKEDGSYFDPGGDVTRAEMAKMICVALNGGTAPEYEASGYSFSDTADSWAADYIEYCFSLGIISGRGDGTFDPDAPVTGTEAAKMLLVAMGYDAEIEGFTGPGWADAVTARAGEKNLFGGLESSDASAPFIRDDAAQLIYNAINAVTVSYESETVTVDGQSQTRPVAKDNADGGTILSEKFGTASSTGTQTSVISSGGGGGSSEPVSYEIGTPVVSSVTGTAAEAGTYTASNFTVSSDKSSAADNGTVTLTVTYNGGITDANDTFTLTPSAASGADGFTAASSGLTGIYPGKQWTCSFAVNGADVTSPAVAVTAAAVSTGENAVLVCAKTSYLALDDTLKTQLLFSDGIKRVVYVESVDGTALYATSSSDNLDLVAVGSIYTYETGDEGNYRLSTFGTDAYDIYATSATVSYVNDGEAYVASADGTAGSYCFTDDAVAFYTNSTGTYKVASGADVRNWAGMMGPFTGCAFYAEELGGSNCAEIALLPLGATPYSGGLTYGWVTATPVIIKYGDDYYLHMAIWDGSTTSTYLADTYADIGTGVYPGAFYSVTSETPAGSLTNLGKGCPIIFRDNGDGTISNVYGFKDASNAVVSYADGSESVSFAAVPAGGTESATVTLEDETIVLYVDTENNAGQAGGEITIADEPLDGVYVKNCYVLADAFNEIQVIVMDVTNELAENSSSGS